MPGATDHLRSRLWTAILRRRAPQWLAILAPLTIAAVALSPVAAPTAAAPTAAWLFALAATALCLVSIAVDAARWRHRINQQWPSWLNEAIPQLEDSSVLLAEEALGKQVIQILRRV